MPATQSFDAALLAGGKSSRFGTDKAFLDWRGKPLYLRQLDSLRSLGPGRIWISANTSQNFEIIEADTEVVPDDEEDIGPLGGLLSVFRKSTADRILVLGVDLPLMEGAFLEELLTAEKGVVPKSNQFWEPLAAVYPRMEMLEHLEAAYSAGQRKLQVILNHAEEAGTITARPLSNSEALFFTNLNSTRDLSALDPNRFDDEIEIERFRIEGGLNTVTDFVAAEEPLEIRVKGQSVAVMMRTPGHDEELATGFLYSESIIESASEIRSISHCPELDRESAGNTIEVDLTTDPDLSELTRHVFTSSSCGVCGKATIDSVFQQFPPIEPGTPPGAELLLSFPERLRSAQKTFDRTGGLHASALFDENGDLLLLREDVGRHNALDKVIGRGLRDQIDFSNLILLMSGRISFELMQKALAVGIPVVAGISAPSSLAVSLARESGQTLVGFLRGKGFNVYAGQIS